MGRYNVFCSSIGILLIAVICVLLEISQQSNAHTSCPLSCPYNITDSDSEECCPADCWQGNSSDTEVTATPFLMTSPDSPPSNNSDDSCAPCRDVDFCALCRFNLSSGEVYCRLHNVTVAPPGPLVKSLPGWLVPVLVVVGLVLVSVVAVAVILLVVHRYRHSSRVRPPLPLPDELDDLPSDWSTKKRRLTSRRERYTLTPKRDQPPPAKHGTTTIGGLREHVPSVIYEKREDVLPVEAPAPAVVNPTSPQKKSQTRQAASPKETNDEIYVNDIELQPTVSKNGVARPGDDDDEAQENYQNVSVTDRIAGEVQQEDRYQNFSDIDRTPASNKDEKIYENVSGKSKPRPAPKPARRV